MGKMPEFYDAWERNFLKDWPQAPHTAITAIREAIIHAEGLGMKAALSTEAVLAEIESLASLKAIAGAEQLITKERRKFGWVQQECVSFLRAVFDAADPETKRDLIREIKNRGE